MNLTGKVRHCNTCYRHIEVRTVPEETLIAESWRDGKRIRTMEVTTPAYDVCTWCGAAFAFEEAA